MRIPSTTPNLTFKRSRIVEGDSFTGTLYKTVSLSGINELRITLDRLLFPTVNNQFVNDAIELALVDEFGNSLVPTIGPGRDTFFNLTEATNGAIAGAGTTATIGIGATLSGGTVVVNTSGLTGTATLVYRLVNDDVAFVPADDESSVTVVEQPTAIDPGDLWLLDQSGSRLYKVTNFGSKTGNVCYGKLSYVIGNNPPATVDGSPGSFVVGSDGIAYFTMIKDLVGSNAADMILLSIDLNELLELPPDQNRELVADVIGYFPNLPNPNSGAKITALAFHPRTDVLYALVNGADSAAERLWTIDISNLQPGTLSIVPTNPIGTITGSSATATDARAMAFAVSQSR